VTEARETDADKDGPPDNPDDARAAAAAANRKRAEKDWEEKKKLWRSMGVPKGLPAKK
jgi:hypothetical protein